MTTKKATCAHFGPLCGSYDEVYLELTHLTEETRDKNDSAGFIKDLLENHETIIIHMREHIDRFADDLHDQGTSDFITGLIEKHEKMAWMLRAI